MIFTIQNLGFAIGGFLLEGWLAFAARCVCALVLLALGAVARALLRKGNILLLDEATSALDAATEKQLLLNLQNKAQDKTLLFITHRPEVLSHCSQVLRLQRH